MLRLLLINTFGIFLCEGGMVNVFYRQYVCILSHEKYCRNVSPRNISLIYNLQDSLKRFIILMFFHSSPFINFELSHILKIIRTPVYSFLDLINLTRYPLTSNWFIQIFVYHCILRFLQIKFVQVCVPQNAGDSLKTFLPQL